MALLSSLSPEAAQINICHIRAEARINSIYLDMKYDCIENAKHGPDGEMYLNIETIVIVWYWYNI